MRTSAARSMNVRHGEHDHSIFDLNAAILVGLRGKLGVPSNRMATVRDRGDRSFNPLSALSPHRGPQPAESGASSRNPAMLFKSLLWAYRRPRMKTVAQVLRTKRNEILSISPEA